MNDIHFYPIITQNKFKSSLSLNTRSFSTSAKFNSNDLDPEMENLTNDIIVKGFSSDPEFTKNYLEYHKAKSIQEFKKTYKGGFFGYSDLKFFGNVSQFTQLIGLELQQFQANLENKLKFYLNEIPENINFSVLPVLKWQYTSGEYR